LDVKDEPNGAEGPEASSGSTGSSGPDDAEVLPPSVTVAGTPRVLLETALRQFAQRGYYGVSVRDITGEVGIRPASLYAHYPSKEHLLAELMRLGHEHLLAEQDRAQAALPPDPTAADQLAALVRAGVRMQARYPMLSRVCFNELPGLSTESLAEVLALRMEWVARLSTILERGVDQGEFQVDDTFLTAMAVGALIIRVANWYGGNESGQEFGPVLTSEAMPAARFSVDQVADTYADLALRLVNAAPSGPSAPAASH
jgi:AcrR family transcriptional regulator